MQQNITGPMRLDDFVHSRNARLDLLEQLRARARLSLDAITPAVWGFGICLNRSSRVYEWWFDHLGIQRHAWLDSVELDHYGTCLMLSRRIGAIPYGRYGAICSWADLPQAAEYLRQTYVGPVLWDSYREGILSVYTSEITGALAIPEAALNSTQLPGRCTTKWGELLRIDSANVERVLSYFVVARPTDCEKPFLLNLGANIFAGFALSTAKDEALRIGLCRNWHDDLVIKDLARWLRTSGTGKNISPR
jgi:hypothetical protein